MFPKLFSKQRGSALVIALFIMIVMAALVVALSRITQSSQNTIVYEVLGSRAMMAAQSGSELALAQLFSPANTENDTVSCADVSSTFSGVADSGLLNCSATLSCNGRSQMVSGQVYTLYRITSVGTCDGGVFTTSRTVQVEARSQ